MAAPRSCKPPISRMGKSEPPPRPTPTASTPLPARGQCFQGRSIVLDLAIVRQRYRKVPRAFPTGRYWQPAAEPGRVARRSAACCWTSAHSKEDRRKTHRAFRVDGPGGPLLNQLQGVFRERLRQPSHPQRGPGRAWRYRQDFSGLVGIVHLRSDQPPGERRRRKRANGLRRRRNRTQDDDFDQDGLRRVEQAQDQHPGHSGVSAT